jgi:NAD kinase
MVLKSCDGGNNWTADTSITYYGLYSIYFTSGSTGYAVGFGGAILKRGTDVITSSGRSLSFNSGLNIYPNPCSGEITIETGESFSRGTLLIITCEGQQILHQTITDKTTIIDVSALRAGIYFVKVTGRKKVQVGKFIKSQ